MEDRIVIIVVFVMVPAVPVEPIEAEVIEVVSMPFEAPENDTTPFNAGA